MAHLRTIALRKGLAGLAGRRSARSQEPTPLTPFSGASFAPSQERRSRPNIEQAPPADGAQVLSHVQERRRLLGGVDRLGRSSCSSRVANRMTGIPGSPTCPMRGLRGCARGSRRPGWFLPAQCRQW